MSLLESMKNFPRRDFTLGFATIFAGALAGAYFFPREVSNIGIYDKDEDGYVDVIEDKNWGIVLTNNSSYLIPVKDLDPNVKICYFSESISMENIGQEFAQRTRSLLEECLKKN